MRKQVCGIYKITSPTNKIYIGQSVNIYTRWNRYKNLHCTNQFRIYRSLKKYGIEKHKFEIIHECLPEELNDLEKYYVDLFQTFNNKYGLNLIDGGGSKAKHSQESINKIIESRKWYKHSQKTKDKLRIAKLGNKNPNYNKPHTEEWKQKMKGRIPPNKGQKASVETKKKQSIAAIKRGGNKSIMIPVSMYDLNEYLIKDFDNIRQAAMFIGNVKLASNIAKCCNGKRKKCHEYIWKFKL